MYIHLHIMIICTWYPSSKNLIFEPPSPLQKPVTFCEESSRVCIRKIAELLKGEAILGLESGSQRSGRLWGRKNFTFSLELHLMMLVIVFLCHQFDFWWIGLFVVILHFLSMFFSVVFFSLGLLCLSFSSSTTGVWILRVASAWPATNRWSWRTSLRCCHGEKTTISLSPSVFTFWERWNVGLFWRIEK